MHCNTSGLGFSSEQGNRGIPRQLGFDFSQFFIKEAGGRAQASLKRRGRVIEPPPPPRLREGGGLVGGGL